MYDLIRVLGNFVTVLCGISKSAWTGARRSISKDGSINLATRLVLLTSWMLTQLEHWQEFRGTQPFHGAAYVPQNMAASAQKLAQHHFPLSLSVKIVTQLRGIQGTGTKKYFSKKRVKTRNTARTLR